MIPFFGCLLYFAVIGLSSFFLGRVVPKKWFSYEKFPFRAHPAEKDGKIYLKLGVRKWKDYIPDMSRIVPSLIPSKKMPKKLTAEQLTLMIQETCIAEWTHLVLGILGFGCVWIWKKVGGWILSILYLVGNLPYVVVQRYNRPKMVQLLRQVQAKGKAEESSALEKGAGEKPA